MLSIEFYLFPSRCFHSDLVGCGCLFRAFAVLCRWRISLLGSWKMEHGCKRYIQTTFKTTETIGQHESTMVHIYIYIHIQVCESVVTEVGVYVVIEVCPRNAASIWIGDSIERLCSWWWTNYFGRCELWQNLTCAPEDPKWRGSILYMGF